MILLIICGRCMIISLFCICIPSHLRVLTKLSIVYEYEHYEHLDMITKEVKQCREVSPHRFECISTLNKESIDRYRHYWHCKPERMIRHSSVADELFKYAKCEWVNETDKLRLLKGLLELLFVTKNIFSKIIWNKFRNALVANRGPLAALVMFSCLQNKTASIQVVVSSG